jgi:hypothetical protein
MMAENELNQLLIYAQSNEGVIEYHDILTILKESNLDNVKYCSIVEFLKNNNIDIIDVNAEENEDSTFDEEETEAVSYSFMNEDSTKLYLKEI